MDLTPLFKHAWRDHVGIEREFTLNQNECAVPLSPSFLRCMHHLQRSLGHNPDRWAPELSACQVEDRTVPHRRLATLRSDLASAQNRGTRVAASIGCRLAASEVVPHDVVRVTHPKYRHLQERLPENVLMAAYRVAGVHVHIGCGSLHEAVERHDLLCDALVELARISDHSNGERLRLYGEVLAFTMGSNAPNTIGTSPHYESPEGWHARMRALGVEQLASCYDLVRITSYGTVEVRIFGMTESPDEIIDWVERIHSLVGITTI